MGFNSSKTKAKPAATPTTAKPSVTGKVAGWFQKNYGIRPLGRDQALSVQAYYGLRELLGLKFQSELGLRKSKKRFDWSKWNSTTFEALAGSPLKLKLTADDMAELAVAFLPEITGEETAEVIEQLAAFNQQSQSKRNEARLLATNLGSAANSGKDEFEDDEDDFDTDTEAVAENDLGDDLEDDDELDEE